MNPMQPPFPGLPPPGGMGAPMGGPQLPPGLGQQQGKPQPIPLGNLIPQLAEILKARQASVVSPTPLVVNADVSAGLRVTDSTANTTDPSIEDDGLPGHRILEMYNSWSMYKHGELERQLSYEQYYHGYQWTAEQLDVLKDRRQPPTYKNEIRKKIDSYIGIEQRLRRDPKAQPRTPKHEGDCDAATAALREVNDVTNAPLKFSEAGRDFFVRGVGGIWQGIERDEYGEVNIVKRRVPGSNAIYDPRSMEWDFADAKFMGEWNWIEVEDMRDILLSLGRKDSAEMVEKLAGNTMTGQAGSVPGEFARMKGDWFSRELQCIRVVHMYYRYKKQWRCVYFAGHVKLYDAPSIYKNEQGGQMQPFNFASCHVDPTGERYGVVKDLIPIQDEINVRSSKLTFLISSRQMIYEEGAMDDPNLARKEFNRPDGMVKLNPGGLVKVKVEQLSAEIQGQAELLRESMSSMQNYGPNPSLMGKDQADASGRAILARQNSGMTEMSSVFERHREFKLKAFKRDWQLIRQFWDQEKWLRITDDDKGFKFVPINQMMFDPAQMRVVKTNDLARMDIDIIIEEGPDVITMNEELADMLAKLGANANTPLGRIIIELSNVRNKDRLLKMLDDASPKPNPEQQDLLTKKSFLEVAAAAAKIDESLATTEAKRAKTLSDLASAMIPTEALKSFPFEYGVRSTYEDFLGQDLHPEGNPNSFVPQPPEGMPPMSGPLPPMPANQNMPMQKAGPLLDPRAMRQGISGARPPVGMQPAPVLPNQEPKMGQSGGLPLPHDGEAMQALMPPKNTRI